MRGAVRATCGRPDKSKRQAHAFVLPRRKIQRGRGGILRRLVGAAIMRRALPGGGASREILISMEDALAMREHPQIAIDGAAGTGKSTIGERVARHLGCLYVDTGAFYRALTYLALAGSIDPDDGAALATLARNSSITIAAPTVLDGRQYTVLDNGQDITRELRTPAVETNISRVSRHQEVRQALRERQREMADEQAVVMVGRDIGTVVLPNADLKIVLDFIGRTRSPPPCRHGRPLRRERTLGS